MQPPVTLVVSPRERFSGTEEALACLYENTRTPFDLVYVDGHPPPRVRRNLERQAREKGFRLIRVPHFLPDPDMRNIGLREVTTPYVVFLENDVLVRPGWLEALLACAEDTGAAAVGPLYLENRLGQETVHMAGGLNRVEEASGARRCIERHRFPGRLAADVAHELRREPTELIEFHCVLMRTAVLRALGGLDEGVKNTAEHVDFCLTARGAGHELYLDPASVIVYVQPPPFVLYDLPFFCTRWSDAWSRQTVAYLGQKWRLDPDDPFLRAKYQWTTTRRRQIVNYYLTRARVARAKGGKGSRRVTAVVDSWIGKTIARPAATTLRTVAPS
jgi:hypothetical protein